MLKILVPIDGSDDAVLAARHVAKAAARRGDTEVHLVNVQPLLNRHISRFLSRHTLAEAREAAGRQRLAAAEQLCREAGVAYFAHVLSGDPAAALARYAKTHGVDHIAIGTSRKSALLRLLTGSLVDRLVECAQVPVLVLAGSRPLVLQRYGLPAGIGLGLLALILASD